MTDIIDIFGRVHILDTAISNGKKRLARYEARMKPLIAAKEAEREKLLAQVEAEMEAEGVLEQLLPYDSAYVLRVHFTTPRESVVGDADAAPDEFVTRSLKKAEVAKHLKGLRDDGFDFPNWARLELGEKKLTYRLEKAK